MEDAEVVIVAYGITSRVALRAVQMARERGLKLGLLRPTVIWPFPEKRIRELAGRVQSFVVVGDELRPDCHEVERVVAGRAPVVLGPGGGMVHEPEEILQAPGETLLLPRYRDEHFVNPLDNLNPVETFLRTDRMPHIWCPGCGIGTTVNCFARALVESQVFPGSGGRGLRHRLHGPGGRLRQSRFVPHHARPRHPLCDRPEAGESRSERGGLQRRRRPVRHRRQPLYPRGAAQRGYESYLRQ